MVDYLITRLLLGVALLALLVVIPWQLYQERQQVLAQMERRPDALVIMNWHDYLDLELVAEFEALHGVEVKLIYFEDSYHRSLMMQADGSRGVDLLVLSEHEVENYRDRGWLAAVDEQRIPNLLHLDPLWISRYAYATTHAVPYLWGTTGLLYRSDLVSEPITRWMEVFRPRAELMGQIQMFQDPRELLIPALLALGYDVNTNNMEEYRLAIALIEQQRRDVRSYTLPLVEERSPLVRGDVVVAMSYNGDAVRLQELNQNLTYVIPEEGCSLWMDFWVVMEQSRNQELAYQFLDFLNDPENAARNAAYLHYAPANRSAKTYLKEDFMENKTIFPERQVLERCVVQPQLPAWVRYQVDRNLMRLVEPRG